ncbi:MAG: MBL fold metallo-hydrolase [Candidatus Yanofskybacteria bacterium]|nr:MBL fold metallo-hydrolase [Candidatus Yanofskybacteria bacterium]
MIITWFGHSCFRIETHSTSSGQGKEGVSILIDPFSKDIGLKPPRIKDDLVLVTHDHYDHNNIEGAAPETMIINGPGEYEKQGIYVRGILSYHDKAKGQERGLNTMYVIKAEDMVICHMGDFGQAEFEGNQLDDIGDVDILMLPIGGKYTVDYKEAVEAVGKIEPKIVIPMHYKIKDLKIDVDGPDKFIKELGLTPEKVDSSASLGAGKYKIAKKNLPVEEVKLILFQN